MGRFYSACTRSSCQQPSCVLCPLRSPRKTQSARDSDATPPHLHSPKCSVLCLVCLCVCALQRAAAAGLRMTRLALLTCRYRLESIDAQSRALSPRPLPELRRAHVRWQIAAGTHSHRRIFCANEYVHARTHTHTHTQVSQRLQGLSPSSRTKSCTKNRLGARWGLGVGGSCMLQYCPPPPAPPLPPPPPPP